jgi:hypothetical protein
MPRFFDDPGARILHPLALRAHISQSVVSQILRAHSSSLYGRARLRVPVALAVERNQPSP